MDLVGWFSGWLVSGGLGIEVLFDEFVDCWWVGSLGLFLEL